MGRHEIPDLLEYERLTELLGKKIKLNFEIKDGEGLPNKLTRTFCQYEFYHMKQPGDENASEDDEDDLDAQIGLTEGNGPSMKKKVFSTEEVDDKNSTPRWSYNFSHFLNIDEDLLMKFQSDSIAVSVIGQQD